MSNRKNTVKRRCRYVPRRTKLSSSHKITPVSCGRLGCMAMLLAACHVCPCPATTLLFQYYVVRGLTMSLLGGWAVIVPAGEWGFLLGAVARKIHG